MSNLDECKLDWSHEEEPLNVPAEGLPLQMWNRLGNQAERFAIELLRLLQGAFRHGEIDVGKLCNHFV